MERPSEVLKRINELAQERLLLWSKGHLVDADRERIGRITMELDRLWERRREERAATAHGMPIRRLLMGEARRSSGHGAA